MTQRQELNDKNDKMLKSGSQSAANRVLFRINIKICEARFVIIRFFLFIYYFTSCCEREMRETVCCVYAAKANFQHQRQNKLLRLHVTALCEYCGIYKITTTTKKGNQREAD